MMKQEVRWRRTLLCTALAAAVTVAALLVLPPRIAPADARRLFESPRSAWEGALSLWHLGGWRTAAGSRGEQLARVAAWYENRNKGLYIQIENVTAEQFSARLAAGRQPDILTWPGGMVSPETLPLVPIPFGQELETALVPAIPWAQDGALAVPWVWGGTVVLINADMAARRSAALPDGPGWTAEELLELAAQMEHRTGRSQSIQVYGIAAAGEGLLCFAVPGAVSLPDDVLDPASTLWQAWESFAGGRAGILMGSQWEVAAIERLRGQGKGFEVLVMPVPRDLAQPLQVQWMGVVDSGEDARSGMAVRFAETLLSAENQSVISEKTGCLSALRGRSGSDAVRDILLSAAASGAVMLVNPLRQLAQTVALEAALGDEAARRAVSTRCFYVPPPCIQGGDDVE
ncbi:MAG: extracellular solute-binding protein [Clostridiales bacterium]|nr:extracellular solute-binding protein [Clostridiales bacterium]